MGHSIQDYRDFLGLVQELMNKRRIEFCKETKGQAVNVLQKEIPKLVIIYYRGRGQQALAKAPIHPIPKVVDKGRLCIRFNPIYLVFCIVYHLFWTF